MYKLLILLIFIFQYAYALDVQSARTLSLAKGGRAGALLCDTITLNPSLLGFYEISAISGTLGWQHPSTGIRPFHGAAVDGRNEYFSAGVSFTQAQKGNFIHVGVAKKALDWLSLGAHGKRFATRTSGPGSPPEQYLSYDFGVSATVVIPQDALPLPLQIALTSDNLRNVSEPLIGPREVAVGLKTNIKDILMLYFDDAMSMYKNGSTSQLYSFGPEISLGNDFYLRGGLYGFQKSGYGLGGGWVGPKLGWSYGYQKRTSALEREYQHAVTLDIYM